MISLNEVFKKLLLKFRVEEDFVQLEIEQKWNVRGRGALIIPRLPRPRVSGFHGFQDEVQLFDSSGHPIRKYAEFGLEHFHLVSHYTMWRIILIIAGIDAKNICQVKIPASAYTKITFG